MKQFFVHQIVRARPLRRLLAAAAAAMTTPAPAALAEPGVTLAERLDALRAAYPLHIAEITPTHVVMRDGRKLEIDDGKNKSFEDKLEHADIEDMLSQIYPVGACASRDVRPPDFDPGRIRPEGFFKAVYGDTKDAVQASLVTVDWFGETMTVHGGTGLRDSLAAVAAELWPKFKDLKNYLVPNGGSFMWRPIAGTGRLSTHSFGIAIDISVKETEYWRWAPRKPAERLAARKHVPTDIVAAFERQGFIWGGNWYHYDSMHFEYRPELIRIGEIAKERGCLPK